MKITYLNCSKVIILYMHGKQPAFIATCIPNQIWHWAAQALLCSPETVLVKHAVHTAADGAIK